MVNKCIAPKCKFNYDSEIKLRKTQSPHEKTSIFEFPKDPERRRLWISRIPRKDWKPSEKQRLFICESHFKSEDIIKESTDSNVQRKKQKESNRLYAKRYSDTAIPCIWPNAPEHLTHVTSARSTTCTTSESRAENVQRHQNDIERLRIEKDSWRSLEELNSKSDQLSLSGVMTKILMDEYILFFKLCTIDIPRLLFSVKITVDLKVSVVSGGVKLKDSQVRQICGTDISKLSSLNKIFEHLNSQKEVKLSDTEFIDDVIEKLEQRFNENVKIKFVCEQLALVFKHPNARRYSPSLLAMTILLQRISPSCYKQMYDDDFFTLPCPTHLRRLCPSIDLNTLTLSVATVAYLEAKFKRLKG